MFKGLDKLMNTVKNWWILLILGIICVLCAFGVFAAPAVGTRSMAIILTANLISTGILGIAFVISNRENIPSWGWKLVLPILTLIAGCSLLVCPAEAVVMVVCIFAAGALFRAIETITYAIAMSKIPNSQWGWTLVAGILGLIFAILLFMNPLFTAGVIGYMVAFALLFMGIGSIIVSLRLAKVKGAVKDVQEAMEEAVKKD